MRTFITIAAVGLLIFLVVSLFLLGIGLGIGFGLSWLLPAIDLGTATLIGVITAALAIYLLLQTIGVLIEQATTYMTHEEGVPGVPDPADLPPPPVGRRRRKWKV